MKWPILMTAALILSSLAASAETPKRQLRAGDAFLIVSDRESSEQTNYGSTSSSSDRDSIVQRVIAVREDGLELEYDFPKDTRPEERAGNWQLPVRVLKPARGPLQLLNGPELEARVDPWLRKSGWTRAICDKLIFTWNAFRIDCDPRSVLAGLEHLNIQPDDLREGALYADPDAVAPTHLTRKASASGASFVAELAIDSEKARNERAQTDVGVAEISGKPKTFEAALRDHADEVISGTITVTFDADAAGNVIRRTKVAKQQVKEKGGRIESRVVTETIERKPVTEKAD